MKLRGGEENERVTDPTRVGVGGCFFLSDIIISAFRCVKYVDVEIFNSLDLHFSPNLMDQIVNSFSFSRITSLLIYF